MSNLYRCCKPFSDEKCSKSIRNLSESNKVELNQLYQTDRFNSCKRICNSCYRKLCTILKNDPTKNSDNIEVADDSFEFKIQENDKLINNINSEIIPNLINEITPIKKKFCGRSNYVKNKLTEVSKSIYHTLTNEIPEALDYEENNMKAKYFDEIMENLKFHYHNGDRLVKIQILSLLPQDMSLQEIRQHFGENVSEQEIYKSKQHQRNKDSFSKMK